MNDISARLYTLGKHLLSLDSESPEGKLIFDAALKIEHLCAQDRTAQEREDHILDCYETIKQQDAEIERLRAQRDELLAELRSASLSRVLSISPAKR